MVGRRAFLAGAAAILAAAVPRAGSAVETAADAANRKSAEGRQTLDAVDVLFATLPRVRIVWRAPAAFPPLTPIAYYAGRGGDSANPDEPAIWLNPDHPELVSPRLSRLTDEIPLFTELLLASVDLRARGTPPLGLEGLAGDRRRLAAAELAGRVAVVTRFTSYPAVDDAEFARRAFAFAVLRQMTLALGALDAGRGALERPDLEAWIRTFVLATADRQPGDSEVRAAYESARSRDAAASGDRFAARRAFAAPYVNQVAELLGK
jgi:hypothetical protein